MPQVTDEDLPVVSLPLLPGDVAHRSTEQGITVQMMRDAFNLFDSDGSGQIGCEELGQLLRAIGLVVWLSGCCGMTELFRRLERLRCRI